ncbi:orotidine-5'-phosphate decarboxylase [Bacteroidota bacterium]
MTSFEKLGAIQKKNNSILCVGLDSDIEKIPKHLGKNIDALFEFNKTIIDSTKDLVCAYKINFAFYEQYGVEGFKILKETFDYIPDDIFTIADSKRGDIGNTSRAYAKSCFEYFNADSITVSPFMGEDSVRPFLEYSDKMVFILTLTSNKGSLDFQRLDAEGEPLYKQVINKTKLWAKHEFIGYVFGATNPVELLSIRQIIPDNFVLIPGIGTQGGNIKQIMKANFGKPSVINVSRSVIYASGEKDFAEKAREKALFYKDCLNKYK